MGFRINTNVAALDAHKNSVMNNRSLDNSLSRLSSGLRINKAADDASGMAIADSLRMQANSLGQAIANANDGIGIIQTADKAMDEQLKILDTIKTKAIQAANDGQNANSRSAIQKDVNRLLEQLDNIAKTTSFNGQALLSGNFTNKEFQVGAFSNETVKVSVNDTQSEVIGRINATDDYTALGNTLKVTNTAGVAAGETVLSVGAAADALDGLGKGDIIKFVGDDTEYTIKNVTKSEGSFELANKLIRDVDNGTQLYTVANASENNHLRNAGAAIADGDTSITLSAATSGGVVDTDALQLTGLAVGDVLTITNSVGTSSDVTINQINLSTGEISFGTDTVISAAGASAASITLKSSASFDSDTSTVTTQAGAGSNTVTMSSATDDSSYLKGLAIGDVINFEGDSTDYTVLSVTTTDGQIVLDQGLQQNVDIGAKITVKSNANENEQVNFDAALADAATSFVVTDNDINGLAIGDIIETVNSAGTSIDLEITGLANSTGTVSFATVTGGGAIASGGATGFTLKSSATLGETFKSSDYAQYTVEGFKLEAAQMTDSSGNGVANGGLGKVADLVNAISDKTNVKATAIVEAEGSRAVKGGTLTEDIKINGELILAEGTDLVEGDTNQKLVDAINAKQSLTGVSATLDTQSGALSMSSDGRVMSLSGFTTVAGINDGVNAGKLEYTQKDTSVIDVKAEHFSDAALTKTNEDFAQLHVRQEQDAFNLRDLVSGENEDGSTGLLMTREDAMVAMNIVETAIEELDSTRADLGSVQNQLTVTVNNISVTRVNVQAAESQLRDVDFAAESAAFSKYNILAQSGSYAMSQANAVQQNVLRLLQ